MRELLRLAVAVLAWLAMAAHAAAPQRIISLLPSLTETVCELGHCDALVAVDDFSNWPDRVRTLPRLGGLEDANLERILALKPDLVLAALSSRIAGRLQALGIPVYGADPRTLADIQRVLLDIGRLLDETEAAERLWRRIQRDIVSAALDLPMSARDVKVYVELDDGPYAASESSHIGELLVRMGMVDIIPGSLGSVPKINPEFVVRADPQVIVVDRSRAAGLRARPGWNRIRAVRDNRVCAISREESDVLVRPGPRVAEAARLLAACIAGTKR